MRSPLPRPSRHVRFAAFAALGTASLALSGCTGGFAPGAATIGSTTSSSSPVSTSPTSPPTAGAISLHATAARWRLPIPLAREAAVVVGNRVLVAGGLLSGDVTTSSAYWLKPGSGHTHPVASLSVPVHDTAGGVGGSGNALVVGGGSSVSLDVVQRFDASSNSWAVVGRLPTARSDLAVAGVGGTLYVVGGYSGASAASASILRSSNGTSWTTVARLRDPVRYPATAVVGHVLWVFGGERSGVEHDTVQRVNLVTGRSKITAHLPQAIGHAMAVPVGGQILVCGGRTNHGGISRTCSWFDPATSAVTRAGRLPWPLADSAVVTVGSTSYLLGGENPNVTDRVVRLQVNGLTASSSP